MPPAFRRVALAAAQAAYDKKAESLALYHVGAGHPLADYLLIMTGLSNSHMESLEHGIVEELKLSGLRPLRRARPESDHWRVLDYGDLVVHILTHEAREFYRLDKLYPEARKVQWAKRPRRLRACSQSAPVTRRPARTGSRPTR